MDEITELIRSVLNHLHDAEVDSTEERVLKLGGCLGHIKSLDDSLEKVAGLDRSLSESINRVSQPRNERSCHSKANSGIKHEFGQEEGEG